MAMNGFRLRLALVAVISLAGAACSAGNAGSTPTPVRLTSTAVGQFTVEAATPTPDPELDTETSAPAASAPQDAPISSVVLPDARLTPGDVLPVGIGDICVSGYSARVRNVSTATKSAVYAEYHIVSHTTGQYEVDHLIPLELGGSNDIRNLWPEPAEPTPGFHQKDTLENRLHALVCAGDVDLVAAQRAIASNWYAAYVQYVGAGVAPSPVPVAPAAPPPQPTVASAPGTVAVMFTSVVGGPPGGVAHATVQTNSGAVCSIKYVTPAGTTSAAQGLYPQTAGPDGMVSWSWNIGPSTRPGTGTVVVTCGDSSASAPITIG